MSWGRTGSESPSSIDFFFFRRLLFIMKGSMVRVPARYAIKRLTKIGTVFMVANPNEISDVLVKLNPAKKTTKAIITRKKTIFPDIYFLFR